jgi:hypothetical protein
MLGNYEKLFDRLDCLEPPGGLLDKVILRVSLERQPRTTKARIVVFGALSLFSLAAFVPAWSELQSELSQSGFLHFASLLFSDLHAVAVYWREFMFSLLESLPVLGVVAVLGAAFVLISSLKLLIHDVGAVYMSPVLAKSK